MAEHPTPFLPSTRSGLTLLVAASVLGAAALAQLLALGWHMARHGGANQAQTPANQIVAPSPALALAGAAPQAGAVPLASSAALPLPTPSAEASGAESIAAGPMPAIPGAAAETPVEPPPMLARPTPAIGARNQFSPTELIDQARELRQRGDMRTALARLRDAQAADPDNPAIIAETALTYEKMQLDDRAFEQWQRLYNMGESIGALYYMADGRLHSAPGAAGGQPNSALTAKTNALAGTGRDVEGFQENSVLKVTNLSLQEVEDPAAEKKLSLKIAVKNKPGVVIDPRKVSIKAIFYDLLDGKDVVNTNAFTGFNWLTAPVNWANDETEILETTYLRPKGEILPEPAAPEAAATPEETPAARPIAARGKGKGKTAAPTAAAGPAAPPKPSVRVYLGYSVWIYYDRQLQDQQAEPVSLLQKFPPPLTLAPE